MVKDVYYHCEAVLIGSWFFFLLIFFLHVVLIKRILKTLWMHFCKIMGTVLLAAGKNHLHVGRSSKMEIVCTF